MSIKCKVYGSKLYCYDKETKKVKVYLAQDFDIEECPRSVIQNFINDDYDAEIIFNDDEVNNV